ncbi:putative reverse transcriptase domain-containing protein [Tanacetum coccineum]
MAAATEALIFAVVIALPSSPPPSPLTLLSSLLLQIPSSPLLVISSPLPLPSPHTYTSSTYAGVPLSHRAAMIRSGAASPSTHHSSEIPSPPLLLLFTTHIDDILKANMPLRKRARVTAPTGSFVDTVDATAGRLMSREVGYMITDVLDDMVGDIEGRAPTTLEDLSQRVTDLAATLAQDTHEIDRRYHLPTAMLLESEDRYSRQAWSQAIDCNKAVHVELLAYRVEKMAPRRNATTTPMTDAQIKTLIAQGVSTALDEYEATRGSGNGDDSHDSRTGGRRKCLLLLSEPIMESVFHISNCTIACQIKFATCTLHGNALTWWNSHVKTFSHEVAYEMTLKALKKMMTDKYCPRGEIKKLEIKLMFPEESDKVEKYVGGLPNMIQGIVMASKPKTMQNATDFAIELMDQKICKMWQWPTLLVLGRREHTEDLNLCSLNATTIMMGSVLLSTPTARGLAIWPETIKGHYKKDCSKLKNKNQGNQAGNGNVVGTTGTNPNSNVVTGTFLLNNRYASILFDTGADRSFVSTAFSSLIDIIPTALDHDYDVELADGKIIGYHAVIVCDEKIVRIPFGNEILIVRGDESNNGHESRLNIISCTKTQKYLLKRCKSFLAHITTKKTKDKLGDLRRANCPRLSRRTCLTKAFIRDPFLTLGSSGLVCQEEGWIIPDRTYLALMKELENFTVIVKLRIKGLGVVLNANTRKTEARKQENLEAEDVGGMLVETSRESENAMKEKLEPHADGTRETEVGCRAMVI